MLLIKMMQAFYDHCYKTFTQKLNFITQDFEVPDYVYDKLKIPSLEKVEFRNLKQFFSYENSNESKMYLLFYHTIIIL